MTSEIISRREYIEQLCDEYIKNHTRKQKRDELISEFNIEKRDVKGYHGREILELLQNADDAYQKSIDLNPDQKPAKDLNVRITYKVNRETNEHILTVSNTGTFFDEAGIKAIVQGNNSPKKGTYIGNKGTGFRSLLNWATEVQIHSGDWHVQFSRKIANECFEKVRHEEQIYRQLQTEPNLQFSMLALPQFMENEQGYDETIIKVTIDPSKQRDEFSVEKQISSIDLRTLLFLPNVAQIYIEKDDGFVCYKREQEDNGRMMKLRKVTEFGIEQEERFYLFKTKKEGLITEDNSEKDVLLSVAVPTNFESFTAGTLYTFFPLLDAPSPFNCVMHASYDLGDHRNSVNRSETNSKIMKEQIGQLFDIVVEFIEKEEWDIAYQLLLPLNFLDNKNKLRIPFGEEETKYYIECLRERKLFRTVNGELRSLKDGVKFINRNYPSLFCGDAFSELIVPIQIPEIYTLAEVAAESIYYSEQELCERINTCSGKWSCKERVSVFFWWNCIYKGTRCLPNLLIKQDDTWVQHKDSCFFIVGNSQDVPTWASIPALSEEYQKALFECTKRAIAQNELQTSSSENQTERLISQEGFYKNTVAFQYYDISTIIPQLNKSVTTYADAIQFVKWLWNTHGDKAEWNPKLDKIEYRFPAWDTKSVAISRKLYWGDFYGNPLGKKLFRNGEEQFPPITEFGIEADLHEEFIQFIEKFSVKTYPAIVIQEVDPKEAYKNKHKAKVESCINEHISRVKFFLPYVYRLDQILRELSTAELLRWIGGDSGLENCLRNLYATGGKILYLYGQKYKDREYIDKIQNYIPVVFSEEKWVEIGDDRYSPKEVLQNIWTKKNLPFEGLLPMLQERDVAKWSQKSGLTPERIIEILKLFAFADDVTELSSQDFYNLMLQIPTLKDQSRSRELSRAVHRLVERPEFKREFEESPNKTLFL